MNVMIINPIMFNADEDDVAGLDELQGSEWGEGTAD